MAKILIAEDERDIRELVVFTLELLGGHTVIQAEDGAQAVELARSEQPDVIMLDMRMPVMGGLEACRRLKASPDVAHIPVIILSSLASPEDKRRGLEAGADGYLVKGELGVESLALTIERLT